MSTVDIAEHLALHQEQIKAWARKYAHNRYDKEDVEQAITLILVERHASSAYDHTKGELWSYVYPGLKEAIFKELDRYQHLTDGLVLYDGLEDGIENLEAEGKVKTFDWHGTGQEVKPSSLTEDETREATHYEEALTEEDKRILNASVGRSIRVAAEYLGMHKDTYHRKLRKAQTKAKNTRAFEGSRLTA